MSKWIIAALIIFGGTLLMSIAGAATGTQRGGGLFVSIVLAAVSGALYALFHKNDNKDDNNDSTLQK